jgi:hypothetical protein
MYQAAKFIVKSLIGKSCVELYLRKARFVNFGVNPGFMHFKVEHFSSAEEYVMLLIVNVSSFESQVLN